MCETTRKARFCGTWYSDDAHELRRSISSWTAEPTPLPGPAPLALVGPHAGLRFSGEVSGRAYGKLKPEDYSRIFLLGPSHYQHFEGVALPQVGLQGFETPLGTLGIDEESVDSFRRMPGFDGPSNAHTREHSLELHTPFIAYLFGNLPIIPMVVGRIGSDDNARLIAKNLRKELREGDLLIISSDFTHYGASFGYEPFQDNIPEKLHALGQKAIAPILAGHLEGFSTHLKETGDTVCGREPIRLMLAALPSGARGELTQFDTSGNRTGDYSHCVSYASLTLHHPDGWESSMEPGYG